MNKGIFFLILILFFILPLHVNASEYPDVEERVNLLELRLQEYGSSLSEVQDRLLNIDTYMEEAENEKLEISQQLDVLIVGFDSLFNELFSFHEYSLKSADNLEHIRDVSSELDKKLDIIIPLTVSGNTIMSNLGTTVTESIESNSQQSIYELTAVLSNTNTMLIKLYCLLFALIVLIIVDVLYRFLWNRLFKHAFR